MRTCPKCGAPVADTGALGGTYACSKDCGWWIMHDDVSGDATEDREAGLGQKSENRVDSGHGLTVSDEEIAVAAVAFDEHTLGCTQNHDDMDNAWRAALSAAYDVRMRRLAEEAARGFSPEQIGEPRTKETLGDYVRGLIERAEKEAFADGQAFERQHAGTDLSRHGPRHVGWDRVIEALSDSVDAAINDAINDAIERLRLEGPL